jgi:acetyl-CoA carboxylase carboxyltransferase component
MGDQRIERLEERRKRVKEGGGPDRIDAQHKKGKLTARERIDLLLDPGTFVELDPFAEHRCYEFGMEKERPPGDGVVTGYGMVDGRGVALFSQDFTVIGGSLGEMHAKKICSIMDLAAKSGIPLIGMNDSGGARIQEGVEALSGYGQIFYRNSIYSGLIPQISLIMGPTAGGAVYSPALTDFTFMVQDSAQMFITGPRVIKAVTGEEVSPEDLGGGRVHAQISGNVDFLVSGDEECLKMVKRLLSYLPSNNLDPTPLIDVGDRADRREEGLLTIVPDDPRRPYDMRAVMDGIMDKGTVFESKAEYAKNIITAFARLNGRTVGLIANQPSVLAGSLDVNCSDKASRFIRFCDCFNIPLVNLVDVPGYLPGVEQEYAGIIRHGAKMLYSYSEATVPKITVITRKAYGGSYLAMCSKDLGADMVYAWPTAELAVMGPEGAVDVVFRKELEGLGEEEKMKKREELIGEYKEKFANPYYGASRLHIDDVIDPRETRIRLIKGFDLLRGKRVSRVKKKHGNMPL